jgi:Tetratricopeptide repeat
MFPFRNTLHKRARTLCIAFFPAILLSASSGYSQRGLEIYYRRALEAEVKHDYANALGNFTACVEHFPEDSNARYSRGMFYYRRRQYQLALKDLDAAVRLRPGYLFYAVTRAGIYAKVGDYDRAIKEYNYLLAICPQTGGIYPQSSIPQTRAMILNGRAWLQATCPDPRFRNGQQAVSDAKKTLAIGGSSKNSYLETLAAAYAETGDFDSAIRYEEEAMAHQSSDDPLRDPTGPINAYRQHHPYRTNP